MLKIKNQQKNQWRKKVLKKIKIWQIIILIDLTKIGLKTFQLLLTATNLITRIKQVNLNILTLKAWLIILNIINEIIQLVKQMLKKV